MMKNAYFQTPRYFRSSKGQDESGKVKYSKKELLLECCGACGNVLFMRMCGRGRHDLMAFFGKFVRNCRF